MIARVTYRGVRYSARVSMIGTEPIVEVEIAGNVVGRGLIRCRLESSTLLGGDAGSSELIYEALEVELVRLLCKSGGSK